MHITSLQLTSGTSVYAAGSRCAGCSGCYMVITYACTLNEDAILGDSGNPNEVVLTASALTMEYIQRFQIESAPS